MSFKTETFPFVSVNGSFMFNQGDYYSVLYVTGSIVCNDAYLGWDAELSEDVMEGLAMASLGYWPSLTRSGSAVNSTTSSRHCNLGGAGTQSDNRVEIARI